MGPLWQILFTAGVGIVIGAVIALVPRLQRGLEAGAHHHQRPDYPADNRLEARHTDWMQSEPGDRCSICLEVLASVEEMQYLPCMHALHRVDCYEECLNRTGVCPLCRRRM